MAIKKKWLVGGGVVVIVALVIGLVFIPDYLEIQKAKSLVKENLIDPTSPLFRNEIVAREKVDKDGTEYVYVCGEVNAKNRMGAYVGFKEYTVINGTEFMGFHDVGSSTGNVCNSVLKFQNQ